MIPVKKSNPYTENLFGQNYFEETFLLLIILSNSFTLVTEGFVKNLSPRMSFVFL